MQRHRRRLIRLYRRDTASQKLMQLAYMMWFLLAWVVCMAPLITLFHEPCQVYPFHNCWTFCTSMDCWIKRKTTTTIHNTHVLYQDRQLFFLWLCFVLWTTMLWTWKNILSRLSPADHPLRGSLDEKDRHLHVPTARTFSVVSPSSSVNREELINQRDPDAVSLAELAMGWSNISQSFSRMLTMGNRKQSSTVRGKWKWNAVWAFL